MVLRWSMLAVACAMAVLTPARAAEPPKAFLEAIYGHYISKTGKSTDGVRLGDHAAYAAVFTPPLVALLDADAAESQKSGDVGRLDFDPFIDGQDWSVRAVDVKVEQAAPDKASGVARFKNSGRADEVRYDLVLTKDGWRIDDVHWKGQKQGLKDLLSAPN
jgi:hypothetical protein